jgi:hypothetical protein
MASDLVLMFQQGVKDVRFSQPNEIFARGESLNAHIVRGEKTASTLVEAPFV